MCAFAGLRGVTCQILIFEEAAFIDPEVIHVVAVPLMGVEGTVTLGISTPEDGDDNYYNAFLNIPSVDNPEEKMFEIVKLGLACDSCVLDGKGSKCTHKAHLLPPWKSSATMEKMRLIQQEMPEVFQRENMGMNINKTHYYFNAGLVDAFRQRPQHQWSTIPSIVYVGIDPSGGGSRSSYAIVSVVRHEGQHFVVGLDHSPSADFTDINNMVYGHLRLLRRKPEFKHSLFVVFIEANMSWLETSRMTELASHESLQPVYMHSKDPKNKGRMGVITTEVNKEAYVHTLQDLLLNKNIRYAENLVTQCKDGEKAIKAQLEAQMRNFRRLECIVWLCSKSRCGVDVTSLPSFPSLTPPRLP